MSGLALLGSCVTRDAFMRPHMTTLIETVVCRTGFASLMAPPIDGFVAPPVLGALQPGGFGDQALRMELDKTGLDALERQHPDILLVDFMDDRFALRLAGGSVVTESDEFRDSGLSQQEPFSRGRTIPRVSDEAWTLWAEGLSRFRMRVLAGPLRDSRIVLHRSYLATRCREDAAADPSFMRTMQRPGIRAAIMAVNAVLTRMHHAFEAAFPDVTVLEVDQDLRIADPAHFWGPAPCHYIREYYRALRYAMADAGLPLPLSRL